MTTVGIKGLNVSLDTSESFWRHSDWYKTLSLRTDQSRD